MGNFDVIIVGSGPAGVSAAFPLVAAGKKVLMLDGGESGKERSPHDAFLDARRADPEQWKWMIGQNFHALEMRERMSPKLRVPAHAHVFSNFNARNHIGTDGFVAVGSLAPGGLSNAWGCGVARFSGSELDAFPVDQNALHASYGEVSRRIGISGPSNDDLSGYFGLDEWTQPPIAMDSAHTRIYQRYERERAQLNAQGVRLGRARTAALSEDHFGRQACNLSSNCLYGCDRGALYSAAQDLATLKRSANFHHASLLVENVRKYGDNWSVQGSAGGTAMSFSAPTVLLAAGTLATTRLALDALGWRSAVRLLSCPTAAFILFLPALFGTPRMPSFGFAQLAFVISLRDGVEALGGTFSTTGLPMFEFAKHLPLRRRFGIDVLKALFSSCIVGNLFLPGKLSANTASLDQSGQLHVRGGYTDEVAPLLDSARSGLQRAYRRLGAYMLPMSFTAGQPGSDIHYAGTLPMRANPAPAETDALGQLQGLPGLHVIDGACLPVLSEKSHTLTIMANADRIGRRLAQKPGSRHSETFS